MVSFIPKINMVQSNITTEQPNTTPKIIIKKKPAIISFVLVVHKYAMVIWGFIQQKKTAATAAEK